MRGTAEQEGEQQEAGGCNGWRKAGEEGESRRQGGTIDSWRKAGEEGESRGTGCNSWKKLEKHEEDKERWMKDEGSIRKGVGRGSYEVGRRWEGEKGGVKAPGRDARPALQQRVPPVSLYCRRSSRG